MVQRSRSTLMPVITPHSSPDGLTSIDQLRLALHLGSESGVYEFDPIDVEEALDEIDRLQSILTRSVIEEPL